MGHTRYARSRSSLVVVVIAAVVMALVPSAAFADPDEYDVMREGRPTEQCSEVQVRASPGSDDGGGDSFAIGCLLVGTKRLWLRDNLADGYGVGILWSSSSGRDGVIRNNLGAGKHGLVTKRFADNTKIYLQIARCSQSGSRLCTRTEDYRDRRYRKFAVCSSADGLRYC